MTVSAPPSEPANGRASDTARRRRRRLTWLVAAVLVLLVGLLASLPPVTARVRAAGVAGELLDYPVPRPLAADVGRRSVSLDGVDGDLYAGDEPAPALVLLPGATEAGREDPRVVRAGEAIAAAGRTVFVPELSLYQREVDGADVERIVDAALGVAAHPLGRGPVSLLGFSFGGSYALVAAADERLDEELAQVATFGAYFDLVGLLQAATTGFSLVEGDRLAWEAHPRARELTAEASLQLVPPGQRDELAAALADDRASDSLPPEARAVYDLLDNEDPERTRDLAAELPQRARRVLDRFSPAAVAGDIGAPVVAMHAVEDPAVPHAELRRLAAGLPHARVLSVRLFGHVGLEGVGRVRALPDVVRVWRFAGWVMAAQEQW